MKKCNSLPYKGTLVRQMPKKTCYSCKHYGCTDSIETQCIGYEKAGKLTMAIRNMISKSNIK